MGRDENEEEEDEEGDDEDEEPGQAANQDPMPRSLPKQFNHGSLVEARTEVALSFRLASLKGTLLA